MWGSSQGLSQDSVGSRLKGRKWDSLVVVVKLSQKVQTLGSLELSGWVRPRPKARRRRRRSGSIAEACSRPTATEQCSQQPRGRTSDGSIGLGSQKMSQGSQCSGSRSSMPEISGVVPSPHSVQPCRWTRCESSSLGLGATDPSDTEAESQMSFCGCGQPQEEAHTQDPALGLLLSLCAGVLTLVISLGELSLLLAIMPSPSEMKKCPREVGDWPFITHATRAQQGLAQACTPCVPLLPPLWLLSVSSRRTVLSLGLVPPVCVCVVSVYPSPPAFC